MNNESNYKTYGFAFPDDLVTVMDKCKFPVIYRSKKQPKPSPFYAAVQQMINYPYGLKYSELTTALSNLPKEALNNAKNVP